MTEAANVAVTQADALAFAGEAFRNIDLPEIYGCDLDDIAGALASFLKARLAHTSPDAGALREALLGGPADDEARATLGRFGWVEAFVKTWRELMAERPEVRAAWFDDDASAAMECDREVDDFLAAVRPALLAALTPEPTAAPVEEVERIARAIAGPIFQEFDGWRLDVPFNFDTISYADQETIRRIARAAALAALRTPACVAPEGWKLVPVEPTPAMLAAAPSHPGSEGGEG